MVTSVLGELINADGRLDVFEYCLGTLVFVHLHEALTSGSPWHARRQNLVGAQGAVCDLLAVLAQTGNSDPRAAAAAFQTGIAVAYPQRSIPFMPGLVTTVMADRVLTVAESELLRTVCGVLHCPVPPVFWCATVVEAPSPRLSAAAPESSARTCR